MGAIHGGLAGPPCETVSRARARQLFREDGTRCGPRPLRSAGHAGLPQLRLKELRQVTVANNLWGSTWRLFSACLCSGAPFIVEHPADPGEIDAPSMWRIPTVAWLRSFQGVQAPTILQGYYGAISPKPTTFMICNARCNASQVLREARTRVSLPAALQMADRQMAPTLRLL